MPSFGPTTTAEEVCAVFADDIRVKTILVTGVSPGGIGAACALALASASPRLLILAGRTPSSTTATERSINEKYPATPTHLLELDLGSQKSVRRAAAEVLAYAEPIDRLINNAGIMYCPFTLSEDGIEMQFATNHIGPFLFTNLIIPKIVQAGHGARIVNVSSRGHDASGIRFEDWDFKNGEVYDPRAAYGQSKTANILFSVSIAEKLKKEGVVSYSVHPGAVWSNLVRFLSKEMIDSLGLTFDRNGQPHNTEKYSFISPSQGAATEIFAAFDPSIQEHNGAYLKECRVAMDAVEPYAVDKDNAERLWKLSERLVGQEFTY